MSASASTVITASATSPLPAPPLRARIVGAAIDITTTDGWAAVTMSAIAAEVGVSRQTVYNEVGAKPDLAEAMVADELARAMSLVGEAFDEYPTAPADGIRAACRAVLEYADGSPLLRAIVSSSYGSDTDLLPLLTTRSSSLIATASAVVGERLAAYRLDVQQDRLDAVVDMLVRLVLSHVMQPAADPASTADDIAWLASGAITDLR